MENQFECTKIKDGLYLGNLTATQDYEFLQINKFSYVVNCSAQIPNYFDSYGVKYLKFKLIKERTHKLWDESLKKLRKLEKFIEEAQEQSLCCIISSATGNNRSLVMLTAFLMSKYRWTLSKTLEYIRSKRIYIGLSEHYIEQLEYLESLLNNEEGKPTLTNSWRGPYNSEQQDLVSKTYLNSQEILLDMIPKKEKKQKRVTWQDKIDKERKKQLKEQRMRQTGMQNCKKIKSTHKLVEESHNSLSTKNIKHEQNESPLKKPEVKKGKKSQKSVPKQEEVKPRLSKQKDDFTQFQQTEQPESGKEAKVIEDNRYFSEKQLLKILKQNLKIKKEAHSKEKNCQNQENEQGDKEVYKLTINNFIAPNINIMNSLADKTNTDKPQKQGKQGKKEDKSTRALSEKDGVTKQSSESLKPKQIINKSHKRNTQNSPRQRDKKIEKAVSLQFKKNV